MAGCGYTGEKPAPHMVIPHEYVEVVPATVRFIYLPVDPWIGCNATRINFTLDCVQGVLLAMVHGTSGRGRVPGCMWNR